MGYRFAREGNTQILDCFARLAMTKRWLSRHCEEACDRSNPEHILAVKHGKTIDYFRRRRAGQTSRSKEEFIWTLQGSNAPYTPCPIL